MKTSQLKTIFAMLVMAAFIFTSCKKDNPSPKHPIAGNWVGKYGSGNETPSTFFKIQILDNGTLKIKNEENVVTGSGTWELNELNFTAVYSYEPGNHLNLAAKYSEATLSGSWGFGVANPADGDFFLEKE